MEDTNSELDIDLEHSWEWDAMKDWLLDRWLQILGIGFLLIGVGFLFKYSLDHGFFGPRLRLLAGLGVGGTLGVIGWRVRDARRALSHVLLGGAAATLYITLYAGAEVYELIPHVIAFAATVGVTMATFVVAVREDGQALAIIATVAGFATPFFLDASAIFGSFEDIGTLIYMCVVLCGATAIYVMRGWWALLTISTFAMWSYLTVVVIGAETTTELVATQFAILITLGMTGIAPVLRYLWHRDDTHPFTEIFVSLMALGSPALAALLTWSLWDLTGLPGACVWLGMAGAYAASAAILSQSERGRTLAPVHIIVAIGAALGAAMFALSGPALMLVVLGQGVALAWLGHRAIDQRGFDGVAMTLTVPGYLLVGWGVLDSIAIFVKPVSGLAYVGPEGVQMLASVAAIIAIGRLQKDSVVRAGFEWAAHILFLAVALHQSTELVHGDLIATAIWGAYSIALLSMATVRETVSRQWMGISGLMLSAVKLLFVDMHGAETLWRVLLFIAFGAALLALSYWAPTREDVSRA